MRWRKSDKNRNQEEMKDGNRERGKVRKNMKWNQHKLWLSELKMTEITVAIHLFSLAECRGV